MTKFPEANQATLADPALLDKIDRLFACNVGEYISLPQLVVVGDQSSGKSSVLEGLTRLPFPRDSGLCTRFATQIIFRRKKDLSDRIIEASIIPAPDSDPDRTATLQGWSATMVNDLDTTSFAKIMSQVHAIMGVASSAEPNNPTFSKDVFRLEIIGPDEDHLSVIDVPGIFKNTTQGLTTKADIEMVREMVLGYMKNPRSIMLTVIPANVDIATQEILEMARELDPDGERTIGVLTKPDLVDKGAEDKVLDIVGGKTMVLGYGWIVVRNLSQRELQDGNTDRDTAEDAFRKREPWKKIPQDRFGVASLKTRLQEAVTENARRSFPAVRSEVLERLKDSRKSLESLGGERETIGQQMSFLLDIISKFQELTTQALTTTYGANELFQRYGELRLATKVMNRSSMLFKEIDQWGHEYKFRENAANTEAVPPTENLPEEKGVSLIPTRKTLKLPELEETAPGQTYVSYPLETDIYGWLETLYTQSRGFELGTFNTSLLATSMNQQSAKWPDFASGYIGDVITMVHEYILKALRLICTDRQVIRNLLAVLNDCLMVRYQRAVEQVNFVLAIERNGTPMTLNLYFNDNLQKCREERMKASLANKTLEGWNHGEVVKLSDIVLQRDMGNVEHTVEEIHDILESYYKLARKRFVDNVFLQAACHYLIHGPDTPLKLLSPSFVTELSTDQLREIAGEEPARRLRRAQLKKEIADLETGKKILV